MKEHRIATIATAVGDKYVIECMQKKGYSLGGEQSGHIIIRSHATTGDGILTAVLIFALQNRVQKKLSVLAAQMTAFPQVLVNVLVNEKPNLDSIEGLQRVIQAVESEIRGQGRVLVRYSGTENKARVMIEAKTTEEATAYAQRIAKIIDDAIGV